MDRQTQQSEQRRRIIDFPAIKNPAGSTDAPAVELPLVLRPAGADDWSYEIVAVRQVGTYAVVTTSLLIEGRYRDGIGICHLDNEGAIRIAERRALKDAASKFATDSDSPASRSRESKAGRRSSWEVDRPEAVSIGDLITYSQLSEARTLASQLDLSADDEAERLFGCFLSELSRSAADRLIESLASLATRTRKFKRAG